jgi:hypothetical protein
MLAGKNLAQRRNIAVVPPAQGKQISRSLAAGFRFSHWKWVFVLKSIRMPISL